MTARSGKVWRVEVEEQIPPDEVKPRAVFMPRVSVLVSLPPGCTAWRASVYVQLEQGEPHQLEASFATSLDAWLAVSEFIERATGVVR